MNKSFLFSVILSNKFKFEAGYNKISNNFYRRSIWPYLTSMSGNFEYIQIDTCILHGNLYSNSCFTCVMPCMMHVSVYLILYKFKCLLVHIKN